MKKPLPAALFQKYLSGQCTPDEEALIEEWYASFENEVDYTDSLSARQKQQLMDNIRQRISGSMTDRVASRGRVRQLSWAAVGIAASLLIAFGVMRHKRQSTISIATIASLDTVFSNASASISNNTLSDGSHVWLMPGARLSCRKGFAADRREVRLSGEAFFEVTKNPKRPFIIYSKNLVTKVWGTSFRVRDEQKLSFADVTVMTGKVSVKLVHPEGSSKKEVMLYPSQQVTYLKKEKTFTEQPKASMAAMAIWKKPDVSFNNRPLKEVIGVLNQCFQLHIVAADDKINNLLLTADLNGLNFPDIMQMLHKALDIDYTIDGQKVILKTSNNHN